MKSFINFLNCFSVSWWQ